MPERDFPLEFRELIAEADMASQTYKVMFALPAGLLATFCPA